MTFTRPDGLQNGFDNIVHDAQSVFRVVMRAMAEPARPVDVTAKLAPPAPLSPTAAALLLTLADFETNVWLDPTLAVSSAVRRFLSFHTGARLVTDPTEAQFAIVASPDTLPPLQTFSQGTLEYPDTSSTVILQVAGFSTSGLRASGPGILGARDFGFVAMPRDFACELQSNRASFPRGVDLILAGPGQVAALPRSLRIARRG